MEIAVADTRDTRSIFVLLDLPFIFVDRLGQITETLFVSIPRRKSRRVPPRVFSKLLRARCPQLPKNCNLFSSPWLSEFFCTRNFLSRAICLPELVVDSSSSCGLPSPRFDDEPTDQRRERGIAVKLD